MISANLYGGLGTMPTVGSRGPGLGGPQKLNIFLKLFIGFSLLASSHIVYVIWFLSTKAPECKIYFTIMIAQTEH